jgi:uncharacterized membrane protein
MYLLDPDRGARRRSLLRDKGVHASRVLGEGLGTTARDLRNRSSGAAARISGRFRPDQGTDEVVNQRVRAALGRAVSHPGAVNTAVYDGRVFLSGPVLAGEVADLLDTVRGVRGVRDVENQLQVHERADQVPGLQGRGRRVDGRAGWRQEVWDPTTRLVAGGLGGAAALRGLRSGGVLGGALAALGAGLLLRATSNLSTRRMLGIGDARAPVRVRKTITVAAPIERVWALWSDFENFPSFMTHLRQVRRVDDRRSLWTAAGPAGTTVQWDAEITESVPHELIAWRSVQGAPIATSGVVRFRAAGKDHTAIDVRLDYTPPAGAVGHAVASLFGVDPKHSMDDDLLRLKSLLEAGKTSRGGAGAPVRLEEMEGREEVERPW